MLCQVCQSHIVLPAYSFGECQSCGNELVCSTTPVDALCPECSIVECRCKHCGQSIRNPVVLLSIKPKWWEKIASREKQVEIRKTAPKVKSPFWTIVYASSPISKIVGTFFCTDVSGPCAAEEVSTYQHCISHSELAVYAGSKREKTLYVWNISDVTILKTPIQLSRLGFRHPPMDWRYISK